MVGDVGVEPPPTGLVNYPTVVVGVVSSPERRFCLSESSHFWKAASRAQGACTYSTYFASAYADIFWYSSSFAVTYAPCCSYISHNCVVVGFG